MHDAPHRLLSAYWTSRFEGIAELSRDWPEAAATPPPLALEAPGHLRSVSPMPPRRWACHSGYCVEDGITLFILWPALYPNIDFSASEIRVAGTFNDWAPDAAWALHPEQDGEREIFVLRIPSLRENTKFKFCTADGVWLEVPAQAPNRCLDAGGNYNLHLDLARTGAHAFQFVADTPASLAGHDRLLWAAPDNAHDVLVFDGDFLLQQETSLALGADIRDGSTLFRLFAPRATRVTLELWPPEQDAAANHARLPLTPRGDGVWETSQPGECHGWRYQYYVDGENSDATTAFDSTLPVLDPYARGALSPAGPGLITARPALPRNPHVPPAPADAVIVEAHLRDLLAGAPGGFRELAATIRDPESYLRRLGANVLELLPVTEYERGSAAEYHWGYMPVNWFAPASAYATAPAASSHTEDLREFVSACHDAGISVVLDVVYNHLGSPNALQSIDKTYYHETDHDAALTNWSGCGNDTRPAAPMLRRLVLDSLRHLLECYDVDGFRFDLAELLGVPLLRQIERELRPLKPGLLLIAEPWSFRGHIGHALATTGYTAWNDAYREFFPAYVHNACAASGLRYFLEGSPATPASHPFHTLNYTQSHDDHCWLDRITENPGNDGTVPTATDARRTRLMAAALFASLGVPMLAAGQDFLHSKCGEKNTYQRGDLNALRPARLAQFRNTHEYVRAWLAFRLGPGGAVLRQSLRPREGFFRFFSAESVNALAALYNADRALPAPLLFFAINPAPHPVALPTPGVNADRFRQLADADNFLPDGLPPESCFTWSSGLLLLPALSAGLWVPRNPVAQEK